MKTTETRTSAAVTRAAVAALAVGLALAALGGIVSGSAAAYGALAGTAISVGVFAFGAFAVDAVSRLMPAASLLFAMVTYTFQVLLMALAFVAVNRSGLLDDELSRNWLGGAIIAGAFVWMAVQVRLSTTARIPAFQSPSEGGAR
jgi:ATP synthase protein I